MSNTLEDRIYVDMTADIMRETGAEFCNPGISIKVNAAKLVDFILSEAHRLGLEAIGEELNEDEGWDHFFSDDARCCPGDDFAHYGNKIKDEQRLRLSKITGVKE